MKLGGLGLGALGVVLVGRDEFLRDLELDGIGKPASTMFNVSLRHLPAARGAHHGVKRRRAGGEFKVEGRRRRRRSPSRAREEIERAAVQGRRGRSSASLPETVTRMSSPGFNARLDREGRVGRDGRAGRGARKTIRREGRIIRSSSYTAPGPSRSTARGAGPRRGGPSIPSGGRVRRGAWRGSGARRSAPAPRRAIFPTSRSRRRSRPRGKRGCRDCSAGRAGPGRARRRGETPPAPRRNPRPRL